jgi:hypothetical protein
MWLIQPSRVSDDGYRVAVVCTDDRPCYTNGRGGRCRYAVHTFRSQAPSTPTRRDGIKRQEYQVQSDTLDCINGEWTRRDQVRMTPLLKSDNQ